MPSACRVLLELLNTSPQPTGSTHSLWYLSSLVEVRFATGGGGSKEHNAGALRCSLHDTTQRFAALRIVYNMTAAQQDVQPSRCYERVCCAGTNVYQEEAYCSDCTTAAAWANSTEPLLFTLKWKVHHFLCASHRKDIWCKKSFMNWDTTFMLCHCSIENDVKDFIQMKMSQMITLKSSFTGGDIWKKMTDLVLK